MHFKKATLAIALAAVVASGTLMVGQANAAPCDGTGSPARHGMRHADVYDSLTPEKQAQYDTIMKEFTDKTASLRDKLAAKRIELNTLGKSATPDPKAVGKASEELVALRNEFAKERQALVDRIAKEVGVNVFQGRGGHMGGMGAGHMGSGHMGNGGMMGNGPAEDCIRN